MPTTIEPGAAAEPQRDAGDAQTAPPAEVGQWQPADPWAAILEAGAALLQGLAAARGAAPGAAPFTIERDPINGQASVRVPLPEPAVLRQLAKAFEPWLR